MTGVFLLTSLTRVHLPMEGKNLTFAKLRELHNSYGGHAYLEKRKTLRYRWSETWCLI